MKTLAFALLASTSLSAQVLTKSYDTARTSETRGESTLTTIKVRAGLQMQPRIPCIGDARGCEAQPLIDGAVMVLASEGNVIRGVQPAGGAAIWQTAPLCVPVNSTQGQYGNDMWHTNDHFGMMSTGVIDSDSHRLYQVAFCSKDGTGSYASTTQRMFVLDARTGAVLANTLLSGSSNGFNYQDAPRKQRSALLLWKQNGVKFVIVMAGSFAETGANATGWLLAFDTYDNQFKAALSTHAGGWMSGQGPAMDPTTGLIYLGLGNGPYNAATAFGESTMQVRFVPPTAATKASLTIAHAWAPFLDTLRTCSTPPAAATTGMNTSTTVGASMPMSTACNNAWGDQDAVLAGTLLLPQNLYVTAGKDGIGYVVDTTKFPDSAVLDFATPKLNCAKVRMYEFGWDLRVDPCPVQQDGLNKFFGPNRNQTKHQHSPIAQYHSAAGNTYLLFFAENSPLQAWKVNADGSMSYVARGTELASAGVASGMPGGFGSVSDNNGANGIAWYSIPIGDANRTVTTGFLAAYDLTVLDTMIAGGIIPTLWKSEAYTFSKFSQPVVSNGRVYLADGAGSVMVWK